jgi:flagellar assembly factor FliW
MQKQTARFGNIEFTEEDVIRFSTGLIGFPFLTSFVLVEHKEGTPFRWLQSLDDGSTAFLVTNPDQFVQGYAPELRDADAHELDLDENTPTMVFATVSIPAGQPKDMTLNLAAPLVVNATTRLAKQVVLEDDAYTIRHRVFPTGSREDQAVAA